MSTLQKSNHGTLNISEDSPRARILVGLGWDPKEKATLIERAASMLGGTKPWHDLDLSCLTYDERGAYIETVTAQTGQHIDQSGNIYHSGDNTAGVGDGDDEQVSVELKDMDENIHHMIFTVTIKSGHVFGDINAPEVRLADGYARHDFLKTAINQTEGKNYSGFVFVHIYRTSNGWAMHNVSEFLDAADMEQWPALMAAHLHKEID